MIYNRTNGRILKPVRLNREFFSNGQPYDPDSIDFIEIWRARYDLETPELLEDTIYGSRVIFHDVENDAYDILGFLKSTNVVKYVKLTNYEQNFVAADFDTSSGLAVLDIHHNLNDRYPSVRLFDGNLNEIQADEVISLDEHSIRIVFASPFDGAVDIVGKEVVDTVISYILKEFETTVTSPVTLLTVRHNLNDDKPQVTTYDENYRMVQPDSIRVISPNEVEISFINPFIGTIDIIGGNAGFARNGFGARACVEGTSQGCGTQNCQAMFTIIPNQNDKLQLVAKNSSGVEQTQVITLIPGMQTATTIVNTINAQWDFGEAVVKDGKIVLYSKEYGRSAILRLEPIVNQAYDTLGLVQGVYYGIGAEPAMIDSSKVENYTFTNSSNTLKIQINYHDPVEVVITPGTYTAENVALEINNALQAAGVPGEALAVPNISPKRVRIRATEANGIVRESFGRYYADYVIPERFLDHGVLNAIFLDVWHYRPDTSFQSPIPDDTCCFVVYPLNSFLDCGFNDYDYSFGLITKHFIKGEKRHMRASITVLPVHNAPDLNSWILPIAKTEYQIESRGGDMIVDWTVTDIVTTEEIKFLIDTQNLQSGQYKVRYRLNMPNGHIIMSEWLKFSVISQTN